VNPTNTGGVRHQSSGTGNGDGSSDQVDLDQGRHDVIHNDDLARDPPNAGRIDIALQSDDHPERNFLPAQRRALIVKVPRARVVIAHATDRDASPHVSHPPVGHGFDGCGIAGATQILGCPAVRHPAAATGEEQGGRKNGEQHPPATVCKDSHRPFLEKDDREGGQCR